MEQFLKNRRQMLYEKIILKNPGKSCTALVKHLGQLLENIPGKILKYSWKNPDKDPEKILEKFWKNSGKILEKFWRNSGKILEKFWKNPGNKSGKKTWKKEKQSWYFFLIPKTLNLLKSFICLLWKCLLHMRAPITIRHYALLLLLLLLSLLLLLLLLPLLLLLFLFLRRWELRRRRSKIRRTSASLTGSKGPSFPTKFPFPLLFPPRPLSRPSASNRRNSIPPGRRFRLEPIRIRQLRTTQSLYESLKDCWGSLTRRHVTIPCAKQVLIWTWIQLTPQNGFN